MIITMQTKISIHDNQYGYILFDGEEENVLVENDENIEEVEESTDASTTHQGYDLQGKIILTVIITLGVLLAIGLVKGAIALFLGGKTALINLLKKWKDHPVVGTLIAIFAIIMFVTIWL